MRIRIACRRGLSLILCLLLFAVSACAEVRMEKLTGLRDAQVFTDDNGIDTVIRPAGQPYFCSVEAENAELLAYLDFVECPNEEDTVFLRLTLAMETWDRISAVRMAIEVGKQRYIFTVKAKVSEYDMTYYEDYAVCMTDLSLPMLKAIAGSRTDEWPLTFYTGDGEQVTGTVRLPHGDVKTAYNAYVDARGPKQNLESFRDIWPVVVEKVQK